MRKVYIHIGTVVLRLNIMLSPLIAKGIYDLVKSALRLHTLGR